MDAPLAGRVALVTGVSRRRGIGFAVAHRLLTMGAGVAIQSWSAHDAAQPWGADPAGVDALVAELSAVGPPVVHIEADLAGADEPDRVLAAAADALGPVDILVANHARSSHLTLEELTAEELDLSWAVNARSTLLLVRAFAAAHDDGPGGRVVLMTSGQHLGPMAGVIPYAVTKGAVHQMTLTLADAVADRGITVNTLNPGPTDTGWADARTRSAIAEQFPSGRWGTPEQAAAVVAWLVGDDAGHVTGQVIDAEGGFRRQA
jgi:3-oxoacyl-[acyl-carrier protein] reductase